MEPSAAQLACYRRLFLHHEPPHQAWMQPPGAAAKYLRKFHSISDVELAAHLAGRITIAAPLAGADDRSYAAALDIDHGGDAALWKVLHAAAARGLTAVALTSAHADHHGGHVWLVFDTPAAASQVRHLAAELARFVGVGAETYPSGRTLRLPLGVHRGNRQRGRVLLQDGTVLDLDAGADTIARALQVLDGLPRNPVAMLPPIPAHRSARTSQTRQDGPGATQAAKTTIEAYNVATDLLSLLIRYGGRIAEHYRSGRALLHCPCGQHRNGDAHASLDVQPARTPRYGQFVAVGYAPSCAFALEQRTVVDAFAVYCYFEQLSPADAIRSLWGRLGATAPPACPPAPAAAAGVQLALDADGGAS